VLNLTGYQVITGHHHHHDQFLIQQNEICYGMQLYIESASWKSWWKFTVDCQTLYSNLYE